MDWKKKVVVEKEKQVEKVGEEEKVGMEVEMEGKKMRWRR